MLAPVIDLLPAKSQGIATDNSGVTWSCRVCDHPQMGFTYAKLPIPTDPAPVGSVDVDEVPLTRSDDFTDMNEEDTKLSPTNPPARVLSHLGVELPNVLMSIKMTAVVA